MVEPKSSFPVFIVHDLQSANAFYSQYFNFEPVFSNEWYLHLASPSGVQVGFMLPDQPTQPKIFKAPCNGDGVIFSLEVDDADAAYAYAKSESLDIALDLRSEDWGQRHFCIKDPNGIHLDIVQPIDPTKAYDEHYTTEQ